MRETFEQLIARVNANAYIPNEGVGIMAKPVKLGKNKEFTFRSAGGGAAASKYPWDDWFKGDLLMLERSVEKAGPNGEQVKDANGNIVFSEKKDYDVETDTMGPKIKTAARRRYKVVQISRVDADGNKLGDALIIKGRDMTADERQAEDIKRAEEKAARSDKGDDNPQPAPQATEAA